MHTPYLLTYMVTLLYMRNTIPVIHANKFDGMEWD